MSTFTSIITYYWVRSPDNSEFGPWENEDILNGLEMRLKLYEDSKIIHRGCKTLTEAASYWNYMKFYMQAFGCESWLNFLVSFNCDRPNVHRRAECQQKCFIFLLF